MDGEIEVWRIEYDGDNPISRFQPKVISRLTNTDCNLPTDRRYILVFLDNELSGNVIPREMFDALYGDLPVKS